MWCDNNVTLIFVLSRCVPCFRSRSVAMIVRKGIGRVPREFVESNVSRDVARCNKIFLHIRAALSFRTCDRKNKVWHGCCDATLQLFYFIRTSNNSFASLYTVLITSIDK